MPLRNLWQKHEYSSLDQDGSCKTVRRSRAFETLKSYREGLVLVLCLIVVALASSWTTRAYYLSERRLPERYRLTGEETRWQPFQWHTGTYSSSNQDDLEAINNAWEKIVPAHGIVAVDHSWATEHNLPDSMDHPADPSKGVYIIDAYHQIHCLTVIRRTLFEMSQGRQPSIPVAHSKHCFDSLLHYIMCGTSGDTLLYTWGRNETGDGQLRKCIDWGKRAKWAEQNTACYADTKSPVPLYDHFDHCETSKSDGIEWNEW